MFRTVWLGTNGGSQKAFGGERPASRACPVTSTALGEAGRAWRSRKGVEWQEVDDLAAVAADVDVLYQTRIQKERFLDRLEDYSAARGKYIVNAALLRLMKPTACIMHPLPRVDEVPHCPPPPSPPSADALSCAPRFATRWLQKSRTLS